MAGRDGMAFGEAKAGVQFVRWIFGWNLLVSWGTIMILVGGTGYMLGFPYLAGLLGFLAAPPIWYYETRYINRHYEPLYEAYFEDLEVVGPKVLKAAGATEDAERYTLIAEGKPSLLVDPPQQYDATVLAVGDEELRVYAEATLDLMFLDGKFGTDPDDVRTLEYVEIESVTYEDGELRFRLREDETVTVPSSAEPTDALEAVRERMADTVAEE